MDQQIYNMALGLVAFLGGWWMKVMWEALKDLQRTDHEINRKVSEIEVLVAGEYVRREAFERALEKIFAKLDSICKALGEKADR